MSILDNKIDVDIIGFGALNLDKLYYVNDIAREDEESYIKEFDLNCGGSAANTIIGLSRLGVSTSYIGKIADDEEGEILEMNLISEGVFVNNLIEAEKGHSGNVLGFVDENGDRALYIDSGVNDEISMNELNIEQIDMAKIIHYSSFVGDSFNTQIELLDILPASMILSFDPGMLYAKKGFKAIEKILNRTNILLINEKELFILFKEHYSNKYNLIHEDLTFRDLAKYVLEDGIDIVVVKRGTKGVYGINDKNQEVKVPIFEVDTIDTTAAGDSFNSGFLYSYLKGYSLEKSCLIGNWVASKSVENIGITGMPNENKLLEFEKTIDSDI
ncbi:5-dehydro-2-deoxygluconokinase [Methanobrevibacter cuticularis]|uniref:5-dehydro-2-deoxygluconokinase n=1 Tax=Methanobrevibacter cuticularis TaxID=47311 RepID=A0A166CSY2_9EURY|nr:PfkB family carbohydrate kinase [Methanobrevibacter cuticularis]KZX16577.1 5-dehydro-2-deoxygluconokinase [Methanobrevibacter cuticularis]